MRLRWNCYLSRFRTPWCTMNIGLCRAKMLFMPILIAVPWDLLCITSFDIPMRSILVQLNIVNAIVSLYACRIHFEGYYTTSGYPRSSFRIQSFVVSSPNHSNPPSRKDGNTRPHIRHTSSKRKYHNTSWHTALPTERKDPHRQFSLPRSTSQ